MQVFFSWLHSYQPQSVLFSYGSLVIHTYGVLLAIALVVAYGVSDLLFKMFDRTHGAKLLHHLEVMLPLLLIAGGVGGRLLFIFYHPGYFIENPGELLAIWHGGWVWAGALLGGVLALLAYARAKKLDVWLLADLLAPGVVLGQAIGRWGNYFNQEAYGLPTDLPWGIPIDLGHRVSGFEWFSTFHPAFLYESGADFAIFLVLWAMVGKTVSGKGRYGLTVIAYILLYFTARAYIELVRVDLVPLVGGLRIPFVYSILLASLAGGVFIVRLRKIQSAGRLEGL